MAKHVAPRGFKQGLNAILASQELISINEAIRIRITADERRKVVESFFAYVKERYENPEANMENFKGELEPFVPVLLGYGISSLQTNMEIYQKLMNMC